MFFEGLGFLIRDMFLLQLLEILVRHLQLVRCRENVAWGEIRHRLGERVHGTSVFQVTYHIDCQAVQLTLSLPDGIHVQKCLGRMLIRAVAGIDHRDRGNACGNGSSSFHRMAHHDHIHIVGDNPDGIFKGFALGNAGVTGIRKSDDTGAKTVHSRLERKPRPRGRFEEQTGNDFPCKEILFMIFLKFLGHIQDMKDLILRKIPD